MPETKGLKGNISGELLKSFEEAIQAIGGLKRGERVTFEVKDTKCPNCGKEIIIDGAVESEKEFTLAKTDGGQIKFVVKCDCGTWVDLETKLVKSG